MPTHTAIPDYDPCCTPHWRKDALAGKLDAVETWACPDCGCEWRARDEGDLRMWEPYEYAVIF